MQLKGLYYFPLSNSFAKDNSSYLYRLNGVTYKSKENICAIDKHLAEPNVKSKVLNLTTTKDGEFYKCQMAYGNGEILNWSSVTITRYIITPPEFIIEGLEGGDSLNEDKITYEAKYTCVSTLDEALY
jgi:hypothetical protein